MSTSTGPAISFTDVSVLYGPHPQRAVYRVRAMMDAGGTAMDVRAATGHMPALWSMSLDIPAGCLFVVMGLSGSGKSTLLRAINRLITPFSGQVRVGTTDVTALDSVGLQHFRRTTAAMVFQNFGLLPDNVALPLRFQGQAAGAARDSARVWLARLGLGAVAETGIESLSSGMKQRVGLARALVTAAPVLLMDEPFGALDPITRHAVQDELRGLHRELGKTVVVITHDPREAFRLADRIAVLRDGRLVQVGTPADLAAKPADGHVAALLAAAQP
jgi:glycine betaine/proline transport system ATP-binding protein